MKKKYYAPDTEEIKIDMLPLLAESEAEGGSEDLGGEGTPGDGGE